MRLSTSVLLLLNLSVIDPVLLAQQPSQTRVIPLGVYDSDGQFVQGVRGWQIRVTGLPAQVRRATLNASHRRIVLLVDVSGTMGVSQLTKVDNWPHAVRMARSFLASMQKEEEVALYAFAERNEALVPFTVDREAVLRAIEALPQPGTDESRTVFGRGKNVGDALSVILAREAERFGLGDVIVLLSDGHDPGQGIKLKRAVLPLAGAGVRFVFLRVGAPKVAEVVVHSPLHPRIAARYERVPPSLEFGRLAEETGGFVVDSWPASPTSDGRTGTPPQLESLQASARSVYAGIRSLYFVELEVTSSTKRASKLHLELVDADGHRLRNFVLRYPPYIPAPNSHP